MIKLLHIGHDAGRSKGSQQLQAHIQLKHIAPRGTEYLKAWYLHHFLDYIEQSGYMQKEEVHQRIRERIKTSPEFDLVNNFVQSHWEEILSALGWNTNK